MIKLYTAKSKRMSTGELRYAVLDIKATWKANPQTLSLETAHGVKLYAEFEAYSNELKYRDGPTNAQMELEILRRKNNV